MALTSSQFLLRLRPGLSSVSALRGSVLCAAAISFCVACARHRQDSPPILPTQENQYREASTLLGLAWRPEQFVDPVHRDEILSVLDDLIRDGHLLTRSEDPSSPDPTAPLLAQQQLLRDARDRFRGGDTDGAGSKLRGLTTNCISCHTRSHLSTSFVSALQTDARSPQSILTAGRLDLARRDYESAERLFKQAAALTKGSRDSFVATELWLLSRISGGVAFTEIVSDLDALKADLQFEGAEDSAAVSWRRELNELENRPAPNVHPVTQAQDLLNPVLQAQTVRADELHLVKTAYALRLLEDSSATLPRTDLSRKATYLTAVAYLHLPLPDYSVMGEQLLVQTIREYPNSIEARRAYQLFEDMIEVGSGRPSGTVLSAEQIRSNAQLRRLAFGK
ncbi:MAG: hypothetical protein U0136_06230 [Bdellovibrionota bacterium]